MVLPRLLFLALNSQVTNFPQNLQMATTIVKYTPTINFHHAIYNVQDDSFILKLTVNMSTGQTTASITPNPNSILTPSGPQPIQILSMPPCNFDNLVLSQIDEWPEKWPDRPNWRTMLAMLGVPTMLPMVRTVRPTGLERPK